jgi:hypothetical protein
MEKWAIYRCQNSEERYSRIAQLMLKFMRIILLERTMMNMTEEKCRSRKL